MGSLIYLLFKRVDLYFAVHNLAKFSSNPGKINFEGLVHLLRYIRDNNNLGLTYYEKIEDAPIPDILRQVSINIEKRLMVLSYLICQECPYTGIITGLYNMFY